MYHEHAYSGPFITISIEFRCSGSQWMWIMQCTSLLWVRPQNTTYL
jgi:hypothetical protein